MPEPKHTLHYFPQSGNSYKVALALTWAGIPWIAQKVDYFGGETRTEQWRSSVNEMGEVPVLVVDGEKLTQSGSILLHLAQETGKFGGANAAEVQEIMRWILFDNHKFTSYLATYRWMKTFMQPAPHEEVLKFFKARVDGALAIANKHLEANSFVVGDQVTIADFSMAGYLFYPPEEFGFDVRETHLAIGRWLNRLQSVPGWKAPYELFA